MKALQILNDNKGKTVRFNDCKLRGSLWAYDVTFTWRGTVWVGYYERGMADEEYATVRDRDLTPNDIVSFTSYTILTDNVHDNYYDWSVAR